ncbi:flagellar hook-associated protein FlgL [Comamonas denitrificans]|uniref:Flagellar hook-associated protein FlgL n=1 Tax=Comamonas denitrificans TaxID=117506 RepID=A0A939H1Y1_9BURK|nr:flagellar hook-associated protein FlgL [Comamonas denitrificans]MBO1250784.1 flagellar hook-associated protein FlgL [Comamonas denitrificans]
MSISRLGTANMYDRTINNINRQQNELASQMEHTSAGMRVIRPSDDPVAAAQAERARNRLERIASDQRGLDAQKATIEYAESTLGEINDALQEFRSLLVQAGNGAYNQVQRDTLVEQLTSLREQISKYANRTDSNGLPLFRGLDTKTGLPFPNDEEGIQSGQPNSGEFHIANSLNGELAFFSGKTGNGVLEIEPYSHAAGTPNQGKAHADIGVIKDPAVAAAVTTPIEITFQDNAGVLEYTTDGGATWSPYKEGAAISVAGMDVVIKGQPVAGDGFTIKPSTTISTFEALDRAIAAVRDNANPDGSTAFGTLSHGITKSLSELDIALNRVSTVRGLAGDLLNQAERMGNTLLAREEQVEAQRVAAEQYDSEGMVRAISQMQTQQTAVSAALQSYASIQKLSLLNYIS